VAVQREEANPAILGSLDANLDAETMTLAQLEEAFDLALDMGRIEKARELRDRIKFLRGAT
jgi:hypothetical protein